MGSPQAVSWAARVAIAVLLCVTPLLYWITGRRADNGDPFVYAQAAYELLQGKRLYTEVYMNKPPLAAIGYAIPQMFAGKSYTAIAIFLWVCLVVHAPLLLDMFRRSGHASLCCEAFVILYPLTFWDYTWFSTEHFANVFVAGNLALSYCIVRDQRFRIWQCILVGALTCLAFHVRQPPIVGARPARGHRLAPMSADGKLCGIGFAALGGLGRSAAVVILVLNISTLNAYFSCVYLYPGRFLRAGDWEDRSLLFVSLFAERLGHASGYIRRAGVPTRVSLVGGDDCHCRCALPCYSFTIVPSLSRERISFRGNAYWDYVGLAPRQNQVAGRKPLSCGHRAGSFILFAAKFIQPDVPPVR